MESVTVPEPLVRLCERQGVDLYSLSNDEILPAIFKAVANEQRKTKELLQKSVQEVLTTCAHCPNPGIERDESPPVQDSAPDANASLTSVFPW